MNLKRLSITVALGCVSVGAAAAPAAPAAVTIYDATQLSLASYVVVERIGVQGWRSAFGIPGHATEEAARDAVVAQAARAGADGIVNLRCMSQTDSLFRPAGYYCYANAIRLRNERRVAQLNDSR